MVSFFLRTTMFLVGLICLFGTGVNAFPSRSIVASLSTLRGGETATEIPETIQKKKKKKSKKPSSAASVNKKKEKSVIENSTKEKDAAQAMGDAIRESADVLLKSSSERRQENLFVQSLQETVSSVGLAMGTATATVTTTTTTTTGEEKYPPPEERQGAGVEAAPTSVLANYFLKSHGGAHGLQSVCSFLAVCCSLAVLFVKPSSPLQVMLVKRTMLLAMLKHLSGMLAATTLTAQAIPEIGLSRARRWLEELAFDPVSQYVFYAAVVLLWMGGGKSSSQPWWLILSPWKKFSPGLLVGPILVREIVSTLFVLSDILVLLSTTTPEKNGDGGDDDDDELSRKDKASSTTFSSSRLLQIGIVVVDAVMSLLVTPSVWRSADATKRQVLLAKWTSRISLMMEVFVGFLLSLDAVVAIWTFGILTTQKRPPVWNVLKRLLCTRLYINFLWVRRKRIHKLTHNILRGGGASQFPHRILDALLYPKAAIGLVDENAKHATKTTPPYPTKDGTAPAAAEPMTWKHIAIMVLGLDEE